MTSKNVFIRLTLIRNNAKFNQKKIIYQLLGIKNEAANVKLKNKLFLKQ